MLETPASIIHWPMLPMSRFGEIPLEHGGGPRYRVIWAESRWVTIVGDGSNVRTVQYYRRIDQLHCGMQTWVIEKWVPREILTNISEQEWNADPMFNCQGPYPRNGDFVFSEAIHTPSVDYVEKVIAMIEDGTKRRRIENAQATIANVEAGIKQRKTLINDCTRNAMRPWGAETFVAGGGSRNSKTYPIIKSAEDIGFKPGETRALRSNKKPIFEVINRI